MTDFWDKLLEEYDAVVYIPMSSGLSGSCQTAMLLAEDYEGKVYVVNNQRISVTQMQSVLDARDLIKRDMRLHRIRNILEETKFDSSIYVTVTTLKYLKREGASLRQPLCWELFSRLSLSSPSRGKAGCIFQGQNLKAGKDHYDDRS